MLSIKNLHACVAETKTKILKGLNLEILSGSVHAIMGPNGSGKSTLSKVIAGHPAYEITQGEVSYFGKNLLELEPDERALAGVFLAFQYPIEVPGVSNASFLREACNASRKHQGLEELDPLEFDDYVREKLKMSSISWAIRWVLSRTTLSSRCPSASSVVAYSSRTICEKPSMARSGTRRSWETE